MEKKGKLNKKGVFFTILVIMMLSLFVLTYGYYSNLNSRVAINKRVETMNNFVFSLEEDMQRKIYISGFRILFIFQQRISSSGSYMNNPEDNFKSCFFNNMIEGREINDQESLIMLNANYSGIRDYLRNIGHRVNLNVTMINPSININQTDPWHVRVTFKCNVIIEDYGKLAKWNKSWEIVSLIPIENFEDPIYIIGTNTTFNQIKKSNYRPFVSGNNPTNLSEHIRNSYYIESDSGPSYLDRLQGRLTANPNGIESIVNLEKVLTQGGTVRHKSCVDYIYFSANNPTFFRIVNPAFSPALPNWLRLDNEVDSNGIGHLRKYEVEGFEQLA